MEDFGEPGATARGSLHAEFQAASALLVCQGGEEAAEGTMWFPMILVTVS